MNKQTRRNSDGSIRSTGIGWTRVWGNDEGYTWNPIDGCRTGCEFVMPDGSEAICYAKSIAENVRLRSDYFFPTGHFEDIEFHENRLDEPIKHKAPSGIFLASMSDWMAPGVKDEWRDKILEAMRQCPQHRFLTLTKHAPQLLKYQDRIPENVWIGASMPPSRMFGKTLNSDQQFAHLSKTLEVLGQIKATVRFLSAEPLSFDVSSLFWDMYYNKSRDTWLEWTIIGAATNGRITYQPEKEWLFNTLQALDYMGTAVIFKENLVWTPDMAEEYMTNYAPSDNFAHYGVWREYYPIHALKQTIIRNGKEVSIEPFGGNRNEACNPILDFLGRPIIPKYDYYGEYLASLSEEEKAKRVKVYNHD